MYHGWKYVGIRQEWTDLQASPDASDPELWAELDAEDILDEQHERDLEIHHRVETNEGELFRQIGFEDF